VVFGVTTLNEIFEGNQWENGLLPLSFKKRGSDLWAVWKVAESEIKVIVEIKYAGTYEGVDYNRIC
jgi:hypothetical protein